VVISRRPRLRMVSEDGLCTKIEDGVCKRWCRIVPVRMKLRMVSEDGVCGDCKNEKISLGELLFLSDQD
jgi:hypothetical protein